MDKIEVLRQWIKKSGDSKGCPGLIGEDAILIAITRLQFLDGVEKVMENAGYPGSVWRAYWADGNSRDFETLDELLFPPEDSE